MYMYMTSPKKAKKKSKVNLIQADSTRQSNRNIAIIGMGCGFPGAKDYNQFWGNLAAGVNSVREITPDRWDVNTFYSNTAMHPIKVSANGVDCWIR